MVKNLILISFLLVAVFVGAQNNPFPYLTEIQSKADTTVRLYVNKSKATIYNKRLKELQKTSPFYVKDDCEENAVLLAVTNLDDSGKQYGIVYMYCPEPEFLILDPEDPKKFINAKVLSGTVMYVPGGGTLYVSGHTGNFNKREKFTFNNGKLTAVAQPFYYVGLKTKTLKPITLYATETMENEVAKLPANYTITVMLASTKLNNMYLVSTEFGLVGWVKIEAAQYESVTVKGIFYNGD